MIEVKNLTKYYGDHLAVDNISFTVEDGEILGFLGPNGAGKSTTMNMLTGYISSSSGQALINGVDILEDPIKAKSYIGYLPELPPLYQNMTVIGYLKFVYDLKKCKLPRKAHLAEICNLCQITDVKDRIIRHLSKGYRQRVGMAQALIGNPPILILDEPTVGLDPKQIIEIRNLVKRLGKRHTLILSSHILSEIQAVCDRVIIINKGRVAADDTLEHLTQSALDANRMIVRLDGKREEVLAALKKMPEINHVTAEMERGEGQFDYEIDLLPGTDIRTKLNIICREHGWNIYKMGSDEMTLEDIFMQITMNGEQTAEQKKPVIRLVTQPAQTAKPADTAETKTETKTEDGGAE